MNLKTKEEYSSMLGLKMGCDGNTSTCEHGEFERLMSLGHEDKDKAIENYELALASRYEEKENPTLICWRADPHVVNDVFEPAEGVSEEHEKMRGAKCYYVYSRLVIT